MSGRHRRRRRGEYLLCLWIIGSPVYIVFVRNINCFCIIKIIFSYCYILYFTFSFINTTQTIFNTRDVHLW